MHKIVALLESDEWHGFASESMWAERIDESRYRLRSIPFYARGLSLEDVVKTRVENGTTIIDGVSIFGGHSTYRVFLLEPHSFESQKFVEMWQRLSEHACTYERATQRLAAVDVPRNADLIRIYDLFEQGVEQGVWDFEEGSVPPGVP